MINPPRYTSGWESGCGPADRSLSNIATTSYTASGYGAVGRGTIGVGTLGPVALAGTPAQVRFYIGADGNLYAVGNQTAQTYLITGPVASPPPLVSVYNPTK